ncbi:amidohydrolase family protein [Vibrio hannami]|uniref:amidohydrolase family protein n=1 Tax=Vibrio hannami TaxID=2717094 RepID=UPI00240F1208|nr:amidohydrolase family protein [Vibrio hannami]MDG3086246.1 amidohydrolase family protein [Vibrio hannami]
MSYLIKNATAVLLSNKSESVDIRTSNEFISEIGINLAPKGEEVIDATECVIYPGFVNTHYHLAQSVLKGVPEGVNKGLGDWLAAVPYRFWPKIPPKLMYLSAKLGLYELQRSGATTCADHHYLYHASTTPELEEALWLAVEEMGMRFMLCRGSATKAGSHKGMKSLHITPETPDMVMSRMDKSMRHHQDSSIGMKKVCMAPTSLIHSNEPEHLKEFADYARANRLKLHSHLLEVEFDEQQAQAQYGVSAVEYAQQCGWLGEDVWFAHLVKADAKSRSILAETKTGIAHCPTSNCRLGSGIASAHEMDKLGMKVTIGVDGSASAESGSMLQELNLSWLLQRALYGADSVEPGRILDWGSKNGADLLGFKTGQIKVGYLADLVLYRVDEPRVATVHTPHLAPLLCGEPATVEYSFIHGNPVISKQKSTVVNDQKLISDLRQEMNKFLYTIT